MPGVKPTRSKTGEYRFADHPEFRPNLSPREMFELGSFGGTYWRPIYSSVNKKNYEDQHKKYPKSWWKGIPEDHLTKPFDEYDTSINKYGVKVGTTLEYWEKKGWIKPSHPYGWVQWYCDFFEGKRGKDDERQIERWAGLTGPKGRFRNWLINEIRRKGKKWDDESVSPKKRQTLQHWAYRLTKEDFSKSKTNSQKGGGKKGKQSKKQDKLNVPKTYLPKNLTRRDRTKQRKALRKSRHDYKKGKYYERPKVKSFKSKESKWVRRAKKEFGVDAIVPSKQLARASGCSVAAMEKIIDKGEGSYYSSGSRPNQTAASWARARLGSALVGGPSAKVDWHIIKDGCKKKGKTRRLIRKTKVVKDA